VKVTFVKKDARRYAVVVRRDRYPDLWCGSIGYDDSCRTTCSISEAAPRA
jgi:hypothetical protein